MVCDHVNFESMSRYNKYSIIYCIYSCSSQVPVKSDILISLKVKMLSFRNSNYERDRKRSHRAGLSEEDKARIKLKDNINKFLFRYEFFGDDRDMAMVVISDYINAGYNGSFGKKLAKYLRLQIRMSQLTIASVAVENFQQVSQINSSTFKNVESIGGDISNRASRPVATETGKGDSDDAMSVEFLGKRRSDTLEAIAGGGSPESVVYVVPLETQGRRSAKDILEGLVASSGRIAIELSFAYASVAEELMRIAQFGSSEEVRSFIKRSCRFSVIVPAGSSCADRESVEGHGFCALICAASIILFMTKKRSRDTLPLRLSSQNDASANVAERKEFLKVYQADYRCLTGDYSSKNWDSTRKAIEAISASLERPGSRVSLDSQYWGTQHLLISGLAESACGRLITLLYVEEDDSGQYILNYIGSSAGHTNSRYCYYEQFLSLLRNAMTTDVFIVGYSVGHFFFVSSFTITDILSCLDICIDRLTDAVIECSLSAK